jgi:predicted RNA binding protein YcfA (HicA-like mRNA interferase family)
MNTTKDNIRNDLFKKIQSFDDMSRFLTKHGYTSSCKGGSHYKFTKNGRSLPTLPYHRGPIAPGTKRNILDAYLNDYQTVNGESCFEGKLNVKGVLQYA